MQELIRKYNFVFCCIQETKMESLDKNYARLIWGGENFGWAVRGPVSRSGGILTLRNIDYFTCLSSWDMSGAVVVNGF